MKLKSKRRIKVKTKKLANSFKYSIQGFFTALKRERNLKIHIIIMMAVIIAGFIFKISNLEWIVCIILFGLVISAELVNTAIEIVVDMITMQKDKKAKMAKDIAASSVLVLAIIAAIIGLMIFVPKLHMLWI